MADTETRPAMSNAEYLHTQQELLRVGLLVASLDLEGFIDRVSHAHAVGPFMDPTLYHRSIGRLQHIEALARAMQGVQQAHAELFEQVKREEGR